ncbi:Hypothetical predicted protein [Prunus dulcis]|uniref:Uncharacterized protein n=1 Tax=Prunus dulcis TaxID=3755 RepID=A0A5E4G0T7_PRUDU|nr:Hypothetical predicted protein [Prunus dulcis]
MKYEAELSTKWGSPAPGARPEVLHVPVTKSHFGGEDKEPVKKHENENGNEASDGSNSPNGVVSPNDCPNVKSNIPRFNGRENGAILDLKLKLAGDELFEKVLDKMFEIFGTWEQGILATNPVMPYGNWNMP